MYTIILKYVRRKGYLKIQTDDYSKVLKLFSLYGPYKIIEIQGPLSI